MNKNNLIKNLKEIDSKLDDILDELDYEDIAASLSKSESMEIVDLLASIRHLSNVIRNKLT